MGLADQTTYQGEVAAVQNMCAAIPSDSSVVFVDSLTADQMAQVVRGMCGVPAADVIHPHRTTVREVMSRIRRAGRRPVLLGLTRAELSHYGGRPRRVIALHTTADEHALTTPPMHTANIDITVWLSRPSR